MYSPNFSELAAWHTQRNQSQKGVDWQFTGIGF